MLNGDLEVDLVELFLENIARIAISIATRGAAVRVPD